MNNPSIDESDEVLIRHFLFPFRVGDKWVDGRLITCYKSGREETSPLPHIPSFFTKTLKDEDA
jgi:hypothetical protein